MASTWIFVCLAFLTVTCAQDLSHCPSLEGQGDTSRGFECADGNKVYCCESGTNSQRCCTSEDYHKITGTQDEINLSSYYDYFYLSTGAIIGIAVGGFVLFIVIIISIVACIVCCIKASSRPAPQPVTMHTIAMPQQPASTTFQAPPPGYYAPTGQSPAYPGQPTGQSQAYPGQATGQSQAYPGQPTGQSQAYPGQPTGQSQAYPGQPTGQSQGYPGQPQQHDKEPVYP